MKEMFVVFRGIQTIFSAKGCYKQNKEGEKMLKKVFAVMLAMGVTAAMLTGCGDKQAADTQPGESATPASEQTEVTVEKANFDSGVKLQKDCIHFIYALGNAPATIDAANYFKMLLEQKSNGTMSCDVYTDNVLGSERELLEGCQFGNYDIILATNAPVASFLDDMYVLDIPWLFETKEQAYEVLDGPVGQELGKGLEGIGLKLLQWQENSFRDLSTTERKVEKVEDLKGLKIRIMENEIQLATWKAYGSNPTPMAFTELFTALQQHTVDGQDNGAELTWQSKFCEVQKYFIETKHIYSPYLILMSLDKFNKLTPQQQEIVMEVSKEANDYERKRASEYEAVALENIKNSPKTEFIELSPEARKGFKEKSAPIVDLARKKMSHPEILDMLLEQVEGFQQQAE